MIDLDLIRRWGTAALALLFLGLWQLAEHNTRQALRVAVATVETTQACVESYGAAANQIGTAVHDLTTAVRAE